MEKLPTNRKLSRMVKCETIAIDFGTSFSRVGVFQNGKPVLVKFAGGKEQFPSVVAFTENELLMGDDASDKIDLNPENTISRIKQFIGGVPENAELDFGYLPLGVRKKDSNLVFEVKFGDGSRDVYPEELMTLLIRRMKHEAEEFLGHEVRRAVISVPASYNNSKRRTTHEAGIQAGFENVSLINEPTAAAIYHSNARQYVESKNAVIVCLGGGSFDVSVVSTSRNHVTVKTTAGNSLLGGAAFDQRMVEYVIAEMNKIYRKNTGKTPLTHRMILSACEKAKKIISVQSSTEVSVEGIGALTMSQFIFERLCKDLFEEIEVTIKSVLKKSGISTTEPYDVVFAGESTRMPGIQKMFSHNTEVRTFEHSERIVISGILSFVKNLETLRKGDVSSFTVNEVSSNPFSIITSDGDYRIFERNEPVSSRKIVYTNARDNQEIAFAQVIDGDINSNNFMIENLNISGIPKSEGKKVVEIVFCLDGNGVLVAKAKTKLHEIEHKLKVSVEKRNPLSMFDSLNIEWNNGRALLKRDKQKQASSQSNARGFLDGTQSKRHLESIGTEKRNESSSDFKEKTKTTMNEKSQPNTRINEVREEDLKYLKELKLNIRCDEDESHTAVLYCLKCEVDLCEICCDSIHSRKAVSNHKIVRVTQKPDPVIYCPLHPRSTAELVCKEPNCKNLNNPMCSICYKYETHKEHKHERLDQEYAKIRINIENCLKEIEKKRTICQKYINDHDRCISTYCDAETGFLKLEKSKIRKLANDFETSALKLLNEFVNDQVKIGEDSKNKYKNEITKLENMRSELQNMEEMKKLEVIQNCENVERLMKQSGEILNEPTDLIPSNCYSIIYPNIESMNINIQSTSRGPPMMKIQREIALKTLAVWFWDDSNFGRFLRQSVLQSGTPSTIEDVDNGLLYKYNKGRSILHLKEEPNNDTINLSSYEYICVMFPFLGNEEWLKQCLKRKMEVNWWTKIVIVIDGHDWDNNKAFVQNIREMTKRDERVVITKYEGPWTFFDELCVE